MDGPFEEQAAMENVWDDPRPPALEPVAKSSRIEFAGRTIAATEAAFRVLETSHPPVYYLPRDAFIGCTLEPAPGRSVCEWKGAALYWSIRVGDHVAERAAWSYPDPAPAFAAIRDHLAVYAGAMEGCFVGDEAVTPQPGGFYGGWITRDLKGPFKGGPGSMGW
ncbi:MAG: hypothetical protein B7Z53_05935 [Rhodospirillales bacterium 12-71-4]|nr:MAG: hypothetical protein B7Z53_05935 [Rhodospirillales bacterium 12-71-4]